MTRKSPIVRAIFTNAPRGTYPIVSQKPTQLFFCGEYGYDEEAIDGLKKCIDSGYNPLFVPELVLIQNRFHALDSFKEAFVAQSVTVTGKSKQGNPIRVYAHCPNNFFDSLCKGKQYSSTEFHKLLDQEGNGRIFVLDYKLMTRVRFNCEPISEESLQDPHLKAVLGVEEKDIGDFFKSYQKIKSRGSIGVWCSSKKAEDAPHGTLIRLGCTYNPGADLYDRGVFADLEERVIAKSWCFGVRS